MGLRSTWSLASLRKHSNDKYRLFLLLLRALQVLFGLVQYIVVCVGLVEAVRASTTSRNRPQLQAIRNSDPQEHVLDFLDMLVAIMAVVLVFTLASLACSSLWLYYTICPAARQRDSKSRPPPQQQRYSCDIGWDIFWAVMWGLCFIFAGVGAGRVPTAASFATALFSAVMVSLFIASAVVSRRVQLRSCMQGVAPPESTGAAAAANKDVECAGGGLDICTVPAAAPNGMWASGRMGVDSKPQLSQVV